jgi:hypothetical protein
MPGSATFRFSLRVIPSLDAWLPQNLVEVVLSQVRRMPMLRNPA